MLKKEGEFAVTNFYSATMPQSIILAFIKRSFFGTTSSNCTFFSDFLGTDLMLLIITAYLFTAVELIDIKVSLSQDDDFQDNPILKTLWDLEFIRTSISSRHYVPAANLIKISSSLEDQNMNRAGKDLRNLIIQTFLETLDETVNFHPPTNSVKSEYYNKLFGLDVVRFFNFHFDKYLSYTR